MNSLSFSRIFLLIQYHFQEFTMNWLFSRLRLETIIFVENSFWIHSPFRKSFLNALTISQILLKPTINLANSLSISYLFLKSTVYSLSFSRMHFEFTICSLWIHSLSRTYLFLKFTVYPLSVSRIHYEFAIYFENSLWIHY